MVSLTPQDLEILQSERRALMEKFPALFFTPNRYQDRVFRHLRSPRPNGEWPFMLIASGGNGAGKTAFLGAVMVGCAFGLDELGDYFQDMQYFQFLHERLKKRGPNRPLSFRIICESGDMAEGGSLLSAVREWFPPGRYELRKGKNKAYAEILCDTGAVFSIRTHDQSVVSHSGVNPDAIFINEPYPQNLHAEIVGRARAGATIFGAMTPDRAFAWMQEQIYEAADGDRVIIEYGSTWDNCKDISGTNGHLSKSSIDNMIAEWSKMGEDVLNARLYGRPNFNTGKIYQSFNPATGTHVINPEVVPRDEPIYCVIDPHDIRPPAVAWFVQGQYSVRAIAEWPTEEYVRMGPTKYTIGQVSEIIRDIERNFAPGQVIYRVMDPNKGRTRYGNTGMTVQEEYAEHGLDFVMATTDDLEVGHDRVRELLWYDNSKPCQFPNIPKLRFFSTCQNLIAAMSKYAEKRDSYAGASLSARLDQKYKDFADLVRYLAVSMQPFQKVSTMNQETLDLLRNRL